MASTDITVALMNCPHLSGIHSMHYAERVVTYSPVPSVVCTTTTPQCGALVTYYDTSNVVIRKCNGLDCGLPEPVLSANYNTWYYELIDLFSRYGGSRHLYIDWSGVIHNPYAYKPYSDQSMFTGVGWGFDCVCYGCFKCVFK